MEVQHDFEPKRQAEEFTKTECIQSKDLDNFLQAVLVLMKLARFGRGQILSIKKCFRALGHLGPEPLSLRVAPSRLPLIPSPPFRPHSSQPNHLFFHGFSCGLLVDPGQHPKAREAQNGAFDLAGVFL